jgi:branched-chain amino acid transport system ATP-binding protein
MLLVEQNLQVVSRLAASVVVLAEGRVVHTGPAAEFLADTALMQSLLGVSRSERTRA